MTSSPTNRWRTSWLGCPPRAVRCPVLLVQGEGDPDRPWRSRRSRRRSRWWAGRARSRACPPTTRCWSWTPLPSSAAWAQAATRSIAPARGPSSGSPAPPTKRSPSVGELDAFPLGTLTADEVKDVPFIAASIDTFSMLNVLGLAAAVLVIGVLVVYLQARQRARTVSNVLSMRMGMRDAQARAALVLELAALLLAAFVLGATTGMIAGRLISPLLDPLQTIPPPPLFEPPIAVGPLDPPGTGASCRWPAGGSCIGGPRRSTWGRCSALPSEPVPGALRRPREDVPDAHRRGARAPWRDARFPGRRAHRRGRAVGEREVLAPPRAHRHRSRDLRRCLGGPSERGAGVVTRAPGAPARRRRLRVPTALGQLPAEPHDRAAPSPGVPRLRLLRRTTTILDRLGIAHRIDHLPDELSGGEQQRAAFAQAVVAGSAVVVADEPTAELDTESGQLVMDGVRALVDAGVTFVVATHDGAVRKLADEVIELEHGRVKGTHPEGPPVGGRSPGRTLLRRQDAFRTTRSRRRSRSASSPRCSTTTAATSCTRSRS